MRPECSHILPSGQKCRGLALRGQSRCLHHGDPAQRPAPPPRHPFSYRVARWRALGAHIHALPAHEIPLAAYTILGSLIADGPAGISDRAAGQLLRALLRRLGSVPFPPPAGIVLDPSLAPQPAPSRRPTTPFPPHPRSAPVSIHPGSFSPGVPPAENPAQ